MSPCRHACQRAQAKSAATKGDSAALTSATSLQRMSLRRAATPREATSWTRPERSRESALCRRRHNAEYWAPFGADSAECHRRSARLRVAGLRRVGDGVPRRRAQYSVGSSLLRRVRADVLRLRELVVLVPITGHWPCAAPRTCSYVLG